MRSMFTAKRDIFYIERDDSPLMMLVAVATEFTVVIRAHQTNGMLLHTQTHRVKCICEFCRRCRRCSSIRECVVFVYI